MKVSSNSFVVADPNKCIGCKLCEVACFSAHSSSGYTVGTIDTPILPRLHVVKTDDFSAPVQCRHCEDAPCANVCAIHAIYQKNGAILIDENACIGCKACLIACPFGAIDLLPQYIDGKAVFQLNLRTTSTNETQTKENLTAYKCDLCVEKETQACIAACPKDALRLYNPELETKARSRKALLALHAL